MYYCDARCKVRTARPQTLPSLHAFAMAAILWGAAHITGARAVTRSHEHPTKNGIPLCESHDIPAFLNEMTEDVVTQQHGARAHTNGKAQFAYAIAYTVTSTPNLSSQFPFLRRNAHTHTLGAFHLLCCSTVRALVPCCCVTTSSAISFKNAGV